jgi:predicted NAD/FAD-dependent oxidoreductase
MKMKRVEEMSRVKIAIVGAGMSGLSAATTLCEAGFETQIFEKSRGYGGRMATRRSSGFEFDHGAQYFTVRDSRFRKEVEEWVRAGVAAPWEGRVVAIEGREVDLTSKEQTRYVGTPRMNSVVRHLASRIETTLQMLITGVSRTDHGWQLFSEPVLNSGSFDAIILTIPPSQALELLDGGDRLRKILETPMQPCWAVMAAFTQPLGLPFDAAFVNDSKISWTCRNSSKPSRDNKECWVIHGSPVWSTQYLEAEPEWVAKTLLREFMIQTGCGTAETTWLSAHRWRYAQAQEPFTDGFFWDSEKGLGICGDWCNGSRVEGAFLSGRQIAERIIATSSTSKG